MRAYYDLFSDAWKDKATNSGVLNDVARISRVGFLDTVDMLNERLLGTFEPWVQVREYEKSVSIERYIIKITGTQFCFLLPYNVRDGLFFFLEKPIYLAGDEISSFNTWRSGRTYPNYIRTDKPSKRQLTEWIDYIREEERLFIEHVNKCRKDKVDFLESIKDFKVYWNAEKTNGEIEQNGINFSFTFDKGEIYTKLKLAYNAGSSLEAFKGLSNNKWTKRIMKTATVFYSINELKEQREKFIRDNQVEYDEALQLAKIAIMGQNIHGPRKISLTVSSVKIQRMSMHVAEYLGSIGFKIVADEKNSKVIIRW